VVQERRHAADLDHLFHSIALLEMLRPWPRLRNLPARLSAAL